MESIFLTKKVVYVIKALFFLEVVRRNHMTSVVEISEALGIPKRFLEQLFLRLRKQDIVESIRGAQGGYRLARPLADIAIQDVFVALNDRSAVASAGGGRYGEDTFVASVARQLEESSRNLRLGSLVTADMRRRALAASGSDYVYHI